MACDPNIVCRLADVLFHCAKPLLFASKSEFLRDMTVAGMAMLPASRRAMTTPTLATRLAGLEFPNPIGIAAGLDKNARAAHALPHFGFGAVEIGTITPRPQSGNAKPRLFCLTEDQAFINRMGFNNVGAEAAAKRLHKKRKRAVPLGINIGANRDSGDKIADYVAAFTKLAPLADYITVNVSSPNTPGLRDLQDKGALDRLLQALQAVPIKHVPIFLKVAPDLEPREIDHIVRIAKDREVAALIVSNTTISRPSGLQSPHAKESGGLSGAPLRDLAQQRLRDFTIASGGTIPLIAVGGIATIGDAWARICAGASLLQLYTAMVYQGPGLPAQLVKQLAERVQSEGLTHISEAVGCAT